MGGRDGDDGGDVRDAAVEARRGFEGGCGAVPDAGRASVAIVRPGIVAWLCGAGSGVKFWQDPAELPAESRRFFTARRSASAQRLGVGVMGVQDAIPVDAVVHPATFVPAPPCQAPAPLLLRYAAGV